MTGRRDFLRGLVSLPLIGGSVALIGQPKAVAEPVTTDLLYAYVAFLAWEHQQAYYAYEESRGVEQVRKYGPGAMCWFPDHEPAKEVVFRHLPETRAALVLSAVGCDWRGAYGLSQS